MKNILIPTILHSDTVTAIKAALSRANGSECTITLLQLQNVEQSFSAAAMLRSMKSELTASQANVLEFCRYLLEKEPKCKLKMQTQYSLSSSLLNNLMESLDIELVILSNSFKNSQQSINKYCVKLLANSKHNILHITDNSEEPQFNNALYLEKDHSMLQIEDIQQLVNEKFSCRIVSRAKVFEGQDSQQMMPELSETISRNNIDLLIETRKPEKIKIGKKEKQKLYETTGLPLLSIYEKVM